MPHVEVRQPVTVGQIVAVLQRPFVAVADELVSVDFDSVYDAETWNPFEIRRLAVIHMPL